MIIKRLLSLPRTSAPENVSPVTAVIENIVIVEGGAKGYPNNILLRTSSLHVVLIAIIVSEVLEESFGAATIGK